VLQTHLCPFDACWSHWPWWPLHEEKPHLMPRVSLSASQWWAALPTLSCPKLLPSKTYLLDCQLDLPPRNYPEGQAENIQSKGEQGRGARAISNLQEQSLGTSRLPSHLLATKTEAQRGKETSPRSPEGVCSQPQNPSPTFTLTQHTEIINLFIQQVFIECLFNEY
jgi:hypothetical protein